jgi:hypothetical protein
MVGLPPQQIGVGDDPDQPSLPVRDGWWMPRSTMAGITSPMVLPAGMGSGRTACPIGVVRHYVAAPPESMLEAYLERRT